MLRDPKKLSKIGIVLVVTGTILSVILLVVAFGKGEADPSFANGTAEKLMQYVPWGIIALGVTLAVVGGLKSRK